MSKTLIRGGYVLSMDPAVGDHPVGDVLVDGNTIAAVADRLEATDAEIINATGMIVMPGLIDTHRHLWHGAFGQVAADWTHGEYVAGMVARYSPLFTPGDIRDGTYFAALDALDGGVTTLFDWSHVMNTPEHADAAIDALRACGMRVVFGHGTPTSDPSWYDNSIHRHPVDARRVAADYFSSTDQLLTLALAVRGPELSTIETTADDLALARDLSVRASMHVGLGLMGAQRAVTRLHDHDLLGDDLIFLHGNTSTDEELKMIAGSGGHASVSPRAEMMMGHGYPATGRMLAAGISPALSVDVVASVPGSMFDEMRGALQAERATRNSALLARGEQAESVALTTRQAIELATINGARALGMAEWVGSLTPGKRADLILIDAGRSNLKMLNSVTAAVTFSEPSSVDTVMVDGHIRKRNGILLGADSLVARLRVEASRDRLIAVAAEPVEL